MNGSTQYLDPVFEIINLPKAKSFIQVE
jgi:hypothetical protein